jgi:hypothetical protein
MTRLMGLLALAIVGLVMSLPVSAFAVLRSTGGYYAPCANCTGNLGTPAPGANPSFLRGVEVTLTRSINSWVMPPNTYASIAIEIRDSKGHEIRLGYARTIGTGTICPAGSGTSGDVKLWWMVTGSSSANPCHIGQIIAPRATHNLAIERCSGNDWCVGVDGGALIHLHVSLPVTLNRVRIRGVLGPGPTPSGLYIVSSFGDPPDQWSVTNNATSGPWFSLTPANVSIFDDGNWSLTCCGAGSAIAMDTTGGGD